MSRGRRIVARCGMACRIARHLPFIPAKGHKPAHLIRHWPLIILGMAAFAVGIWLVGQRFAAGIVVARTVEALGDLFFDRGIAEDL